VETLTNQLNEYLRRIVGICHYPITLEGDRPIMLNRWLITSELVKGRGMEGTDPHLGLTAEILLSNELGFLPQEKLEQNWRFFIATHPDTFHQAVNAESLFTDEPKFMYYLCVVHASYEQEVFVSVVHPVPFRCWINGRIVVASTEEYNISPYLFTLKLKKGYNIVLAEQLRQLNYQFTMFMAPRRYFRDPRYHVFFDKSIFTNMARQYSIIPGKVIFPPGEKPTMVVLPRKFDDQIKESLNIKVFNTKNDLLVSLRAFTGEQITLELDEKFTGALKATVENAQNRGRTAETYFFRGDFEQAKQQILENARRRSDCTEELIQTMRCLTQIPEVCKKLWDHSEIYLHSPMIQKYMEFENYLASPDGPQRKTLFQVFRNDIMIFKDQSIDDGFLAYSIFLPSHYNPRRQYPLLLSLQYGHACSTYPRVINYVRARQFQDVIILNISGRGGLNRDYINDVSFYEIIRETMANYFIDRDRIYIIGSCTGALKAFSLALRKPDLFAGVVGFNGTPRMDLRHPDYDYLKNISNTNIYSINLIEDTMFNHFRVTDTLQYLHKVTAWSFQGIPHDEFDELMNTWKVARKVMKKCRVKYPKSLQLTMEEPLYNQSYWIQDGCMADLHFKAVIKAEIIRKQLIKLELENISRCNLLLNQRAMGLDSRMELQINGTHHLIDLPAYARIEIIAENTGITIKLLEISARNFNEAYNSIRLDTRLLGIKELYLRKCLIIKADNIFKNAATLAKDLFHLLQRPLKERVRNYKYTLVPESDVNFADLTGSNFVTVIDARKPSVFQQTIITGLESIPIYPDGIEYDGQPFDGEYFALLKFPNPNNRERNGLAIIYNTDTMATEIINLLNIYDTNPLFYSDAIIYHEGQYHSFRYPR
jgi:pimeloyl-ACP methyl ester carboxylesterase